LNGQVRAFSLQIMSQESRHDSRVLSAIKRLRQLGAAGAHGVELVETHFSWVFLLDGLAYKMKKPVRRGSMDYRSIARRERACRDELRLNRRLARSVYLGVVSLVRRPSGGLELGRGRPLDWMVKMRRLPAARMLDRAIASNTVTRRDVKALTDLLSHFFQHARRRPMSSRAYLARLRAGVSENRRELCARDLGLNHRRVEQVTRAQLEFIKESAALLGERGSHLIDGHGDLRAEHVYLGSRSDPACVIDCLEFDDDLRRLDPAEEMAFLGLECIQRGASDLGHRLLRRVQMAAGDPVPDALMYFYMSERASIQAMIAAWHLRDANLPHEPRRWRARANYYLKDAMRHIQLARVKLQQQVSPRMPPANASAAALPACARESVAQPARTAAQSVV